MKQLLLYFSLVIIFPPSLHGQNGSLDISFGVNGQAIWDNSLNESFSSHVVDSEGNIYLLGTTTDTASTVAIIKLDNSGTQDLTFGINGLLLVGVESIESFEGSISIGKEALYVSFIESDRETFPGFIAKYNLNGIIDGSFGTSGVVNLTYNDRDISPRNHVMDEQENMYVLSTAGRSFGITKINEDGVIDTLFGDRGTFFYSFESGFANLRSIALQADGNILVAGHNFDSNATPQVQATIFRILKDGSSLDSSFNQDGLKILSIENDSRTGIEKILWSEKEEKIVFIGYTFEDGHDGLVGQLNLDGSNVSGFGNDGLVFLEEAGQPLYDGFIDLDGKYLAAGDDVIFRLNSDGSRDTSFGPKGVISDNINIFSASLVEDGNYYFAGSQWNGTNLDGFINKYQSKESSTSTLEQDLYTFQFSASPNPFSNNLNIRFNLKENSSFTTIKMYSLRGEIIFQKSIVSLPGLTEFTIQDDLSTIHPGPYFISIMNEHGLITKRLVKL